jgi:hypothetical protein
MNLLQETIYEIENAGKSQTDVDWVGSHDGRIAGSWFEFAALADFDYDNGWGCAEIPEELVVVFTDRTWLERGEYDGSEWWEYKRPPTRAAEPLPLTAIRPGGDQ